MRKIGCSKEIEAIWLITEGALCIIRIRLMVTFNLGGFKMNKVGEIELRFDIPTTNSYGKVIDIKNKLIKLGYIDTTSEDERMCYYTSMYSKKDGQSVNLIIRNKRLITILIIRNNILEIQIPEVAKLMVKHFGNELSEEITLVLKCDELMHLYKQITKDTTKYTIESYNSYLCHINVQNRVIVFNHTYLALNLEEKNTVFLSLNKIIETFERDIKLARKVS